ncbi:MAG: hypothetical protein HXY45_03035 [Syntrophaceae bacterium]|nr:hypothetical protein [Syntrophaceae bacterium]
MRGFRRVGVTGGRSPCFNLGVSSSHRNTRRQDESMFIDKSVVWTKIISLPCLRKLKAR